MIWGHLAGIVALPQIGPVAVVPDDVDEEEPPVRLDAAGLAAWRGERPVRKEDGAVDRSRTLYALACLLARAGATTRTVAAALAERDQALGLHKYTDRRDGGVLEYRRIAQRAVAAILTTPTAEPPAAGAEQQTTIVRLEAEVRRLREELVALWERHRAFLQVLQNRSLTAGERQVALAVFIAVAAQQSHAEEPDGFVRVPLGTVADQAGCSPQRASVHIGVLESAGVVEKRIARRWVEVADRETGEITSRMQSEQYLRFVRPAAEALQELTTIAPERTVSTEETPKAKTWGGSRGGCPEHPDAGTVTRWTCECLACGSVLEQGERRDGEDAVGLTFQDERSAIVDGTDARATEGGGGHVLEARDGRSDVIESVHHDVPTVHAIGHHDARSGCGVDAGGDGRVRGRDDDG